MSLADNLTELTEKLVREHDLAVEALTEKQLADAIRQALLAGDFKRIVRADDNAQQVLYIPYMGVEELRTQNTRFRTALQFYAEGKHFSERDDWNCAKEGGLPPPPELLDRGETARAALGNKTP